MSDNRIARADVIAATTRAEISPTRPRLLEYVLASGVLPMVN